VVPALRPHRFVAVQRNAWPRADRQVPYAVPVRPGPGRAAGIGPVRAGRWCSGRVPWSASGMRRWFRVAARSGLRRQDADVGAPVLGGPGDNRPAVGPAGRRLDMRPGRPGRCVARGRTPGRPRIQRPRPRTRLQRVPPRTSRDLAGCHVAPDGKCRPPRRWRPGCAGGPRWDGTVIRPGSHPRRKRNGTPRAQSAELGRRTAQRRASREPCPNEHRGGSSCRVLIARP
jgi:hypothetical protein